MALLHLGPFLLDQVVSGPARAHKTVTRFLCVFVCLCVCVCDRIELDVAEGIFVSRIIHGSSAHVCG